MQEASHPPNDPKLTCGGPGARVRPERRKAKAWRVLGFVVAALAMTEPVGRTAEAPELTAMPAVRCSAWLGHSGLLEKSRNGLEEFQAAIDRALDVVAHRDVGVRRVSVGLGALESGPVP